MIMDNNPLVSIIIPTYNRAKYIKKAIHSCLNQSYKNIEVLIIDDCSPDNTKEVIESIKDDRIKYFKNEKNSWPCVSRNNGIKFSKGNYINFLDDDDELLPEKIELQLEKFKTSKIKNLWVVTCDVEYKRSDINEVKKNRKKGNIYKDLLKSYCVYWILSWLIKKEYLLKTDLFDKKLIFNEEYDLSIQLSKNSNYDYVDKVLSVVNTSNNQLTKNFKERLVWTYKIFFKYNKEFYSFWLKFYLYNLLRFKYLFFKNLIWLLFWFKIYNLLP